MAIFSRTRHRGGDGSVLLPGEAADDMGEGDFLAQDAVECPRHLVIFASPVSFQPARENPFGVGPGVGVAADEKVQGGGEEVQVNKSGKRLPREYW